MDAVEKKILSYPHLSVSEQREIEAYVESNPEWAPLLRDVRSFERLATEMQDALPSDALLATYVVVRHVHPNEVPDTLQPAVSQIEDRIEADETLRREVNAAHRRLREAEAAVDPVSHFRELTGHVLGGESEEEGEATRRSEGQRRWGPVSDLMSVFRNLPPLARRTAATVVLLVGLYGGLYGISVARQSPLDRLAAVDVSDQVLQNYARTEPRSAPSRPDSLSVDDRYVNALQTLRSARTSTLGLFPRYDARTLDRAEQLFVQVIEQVEPGSFLALEAHFYLGKIALAQRRMDVARRHFKRVVKREGRRSQDAYEILKTLQQERPASGT